MSSRILDALKDLKSVTINESSVDNAFNSIKAIEKDTYAEINTYNKSNDDSDVIQISKPSEQTLSCLTSLCYEHLHKAGFSSSAKLIKKRGLKLGSKAEWYAGQSKFAKKMVKSLERGDMGLLKDQGFEIDVIKLVYEKKLYEKMLVNEDAAIEYIRHISTLDFVENDPSFIEYLSERLLSENPEFDIWRLAERLKSLSMDIYQKEHPNNDLMTPSYLTNLISNAAESMISDRLAITTTEWRFDNFLDAESKTVHPVFVCPIYKEEVASDEISLLPCRHLVSNSVLNELNDKCPYCRVAFIQVSKVFLV